MKVTGFKTAPEILTIIRDGMNANLHWFPEDIDLYGLASTMAGMANSSGGTILLGLSPRRGELQGIRRPDALQEKIFQAALLIEPTLVLPMAPQVLVQPPGLEEPACVIVVTIPPGLPHVYRVDGKYYGREGSRTSQLPTSMLYRLLSERGSIPFETQLAPEATLEDLDTDKVIGYAQTVGKINIENVTDAYEFLLKRGCIKRIAGGLKPTYAALLLFGRFPQQWFPNASILAARFSGTTMSDTYIKQDITGTLPDQLRQAEEFLRLNLKIVVRLSGLTHRESLEYPFEAVRELLVNAVAHRDYNLQGDNIRLNIFADRLVVSSPGTLPGPVTLDNLLDARFARNAIITQILSDLGFVERLGYGLDRVVHATQMDGLPLPHFEETGGTFQVTLLGSLLDGITKSDMPDMSAYSDLDLNPRQQALLAQVSVRQRITNHEFQAVCPGVHAETLRRDLADLVSRGILIKVGDKKSTYYILKRV